MQFSRARNARIRAIQDRDHAEIRRMQRVLHDSIIEGVGMEKIIVCSKQLIEATLAHFESEERAMDEESLGSLNAHQELHAELIETLEDISKDLEKRSIGGAMQLMRFFEGRMAHHLKIEDAIFESEIQG